MIPFEILVVCVGNVCRSPLAERILRRRLIDLSGDRSDVHVSSAGVMAVVGSGMDPDAASELRRLGGDPAGFVARQLDARMVADADLVLTATRHLRTRVLEEAPRALRRTFTIPELGSLVSSGQLQDPAPSGPADLVARAATWRSSVKVDAYDVPDPYGKPVSFHHDIADLLDQHCAAIAQALTSATMAENGRP